MSTLDIRRLAYFGGSPSFPTPLHVGRPNIGDRARIHELIDQILDRKWLSNGGPIVTEFEERIRSLVGVKHCIAVCNATVALDILLRGLDIKGEVIVPAYTFVATAHAVEWAGLRAVFCDVEPGSHCISPQEIRRAITPETSAVVAVHLWGQPCNVDALTAICRENNLKLIFDAAHGLGSSYGGRMLGTFGDAEVFSFHATKFVNSGEGGAIVTNNDSLAARVRLLRNFGFAGFDNVVSLGTNGKMNEFSAAVGLSSLEYLDQFISTNKQRFEAYQDALSSIRGLSLLSISQEDRHNYQYVVVEVREDELGLSRDQLLQILQAEGVLARRYFFPGCHRMEPYAQRKHASLPITDHLSESVLVLPTGTGVSDLNVKTIGAILEYCSRHAFELKDRIPRRLPLPDK